MSYEQENGYRAGFASDAATSIQAGQHEPHSPFGDGFAMGLADRELAEAIKSAVRGLWDLEEVAEMESVEQFSAAVDATFEYECRDNEEDGFPIARGEHLMKAVFDELCAEHISSLAARRSLRMG